MFRRAINNLLSNALRYTPEGQAITVSIREQESFFDLVIENRGNRSLKNIYQGCLTVFIGWIHPDNEKEKAAASALRL
ncbi:sensor kinase CusS [Klebsiella michiganensis]|uniref:Sensor kinase CusS n=1 Tax=Klebsiella michiganensis TaxID=1134687 RepID=A0A7H4MT37_9ENTR|nr:sensor kinase CusS [Klebsiella michiganensis]